MFLAEKMILRQRWVAHPAKMLLPPKDASSQDDHAANVKKLRYMIYHMGYASFITTMQTQEREPPR